MPGTGADELARFGYRQELGRWLGLFSSCATGFSYIPVTAGVFEFLFCGGPRGRPVTVLAGRRASPALAGIRAVGEEA